MEKYLLDTMVLSEMRKKNMNQSVVQWLCQVSQKSLFISVVTVGEMDRGVAMKRSEDANVAKSLSNWVDSILHDYSERILPFDLAVARCWGELTATQGNRNDDLMIAATALVHDMVVVTRNVKHYEPTGVRVLNPFQETYVANETGNVMGEGKA